MPPVGKHIAVAVRNPFKVIGDQSVERCHSVIARDHHFAYVTDIE